MTARSFTEAFAAAAPVDLLADVNTWQRWNHGTGDEDDYPTAGDASYALSRVLAAVPDLIAQRDSARDWAAALEGQNAAALALHSRAYAGRGPDEGTRRGAVCIHCSDLQQDYVNWPCPTVSALSGSDGNPE
jgi:hypothetical protein